MIVFRPLDPEEPVQPLHRLAVSPANPLALGGRPEDGDEEERGLCHGCGKTLTLGRLERLRAMAGAPGGTFLVLVCGACGAQNVTARSPDRRALYRRASPTSGAAPYRRPPARARR